MAIAGTIGEAISALAITLRQAGIREARLDARLIVAAATGLGQETLIGDRERPLAPAELARIDALAGRRRRHEPIAYLLERREFWSLPLRVTPATLIPRPDSETVVEAALAAVRDRTANLRVLDLGIGSGCLLLALLSELPNAIGLGVDISPDALAVARDNARALGFDGRARFVCGDWAAAIDGEFDIIVANPPYIAARDLVALAPEVSHFEPRLALDGGRDGVAAYRTLLPQMSRLLADGGRAFLEIAPDIAEAVVAAAERNGFEVLDIRRDLANRRRCVPLRRAMSAREKKVLETQRYPSRFPTVGGDRSEGCCDAIRHEKPASDEPAVK